MTIAQPGHVCSGTSIFLPAAAYSDTDSTLQKRATSIAEAPGYFVPIELAHGSRTHDTAVHLQHLRLVE